MFDNLPRSAQDVFDWSWEQFEPYYADLQGRDVDAENISSWLADWTRLDNLIQEVGSRRRVATTQDTTDEVADSRLKNFLDTIQQPYEQSQQKLKEKLLATDLNPEGMAIPLRNMRAEAELFREANLPLFNQEAKLGLQYNRIIGTQTITWEGDERTLTQARILLRDDDRSVRERAWRTISTRQLQDRQAINDLWREFMDVRKQLAHNAGYDSYLDFRWKQFGRFDYTPEDCQTFHKAIEEVVVPVATRIYERQRRLLGVETLRPWDLDRDDVYPPARPTVHAYDSINDFETKAEAIFYQVDPQLGEYFTTMRRENLLDLDNRKGKGPGGYCTYFATSKVPFIFMNATGVETDVRTLMHEAGHCFHAFEASKLPYAQQIEYPAEFAEVASMAMELLSAPYWAASQGGYYSDSDVVHARRGHLEGIVLFWPYMAVVDAFQHWVYRNHETATDAANCDAKWAELWDRFIPGVDWSGLDDAKRTGWHRKLHIHRYPLYYVDYGLAQLGAVQVWRNAQSDQAGAVARYRQGLALGYTAALPELFAATGAKFAFDTATVSDAISLIETTLNQLEN
jgi:oligoendopeptidase F